MRQYSVFYQICPWIKEKREKLRYEIEHIDFQRGATKTIIKVIVINFIVVAACALMWFVGVLVLVGYSVVLFVLIDKYYKKMEANYRALLRGVSKIAEGDLETEITEDLA